VEPLTCLKTENSKEQPVLRITALFIVLAAASRGAPIVTFDQVTYTRQFVSTTPDLRLAEYVAPGETVENWTTLVAVRNFPALDSPGTAVAEFAKTLRQSNPAARFEILVKPDESEATIDFLTWPEDASYAEFNIFRYVKRAGYPGLIAYQFAYRFTDTSDEAAEQFKKDRQRWVDEMSRADFPLDFAK
jgi:hypothetical protein